MWQIVVVMVIRAFVLKCCNIKVKTKIKINLE